MTSLSRVRRRVRRHLARWRIGHALLGPLLRDGESVAGIGPYRRGLLAICHGRILRRLAFAEKWSRLTGSPAVLDAARRDALAILTHLGIADPPRLGKSG